MEMLTIEFCAGCSLIVSAETWEEITSDLSNPWVAEEALLAKRAYRTHAQDYLD